MQSEAETFLILKYGSIAQAYIEWTMLTRQEQFETFNTVDYEILMEYEYNMQVGGPSPFEPQ